jgi:translation initiation factor 5B
MKSNKDMAMLIIEKEEDAIVTIKGESKK